MESRPATAKNLQKAMRVLSAVRRPTMNGIYYATTASTLNKRPLKEIYPEGGQNGQKTALQNPSTKKTFKFITSKVHTGVKRTSIAA